MLAGLISLAQAQEPAPVTSYENDWIIVEWDPEADVTILLDVTLHSGVEAEALGASVLMGNVLYEENVRSESIIRDSFNNNTGMMNVNQSSGSLNNQSIVRSIAIITNPDALNDVQAADAQVMSSNTVVSINSTTMDIIENSFNNDSGITAINQSSGNLNIQTDIIAMAIGGGLVAITDPEMDQVNASNILEEDNVNRAEVISNSFNNYRGIVQIAQSAGNMNMQRNSLAFSIMEINLR